MVKNRDFFIVFFLYRSESTAGRAERFLYKRAKNMKIATTFMVLSHHMSYFHVSNNNFIFALQYSHLLNSFNFLYVLVVATCCSLWCNFFVFLFSAV